MIWQPKEVEHVMDGQTLSQRRWESMCTFDTQKLAHKISAHQLTCTSYNLTCRATCEAKKPHVKN